MSLSSSSNYDLRKLKEILTKAEESYYNQIEEECFMDDKIYDSLKELYHQNIEKKALDHVPTPIGRLIPLPIWMGSMDNINYGTKQVDKWNTKSDSFHISAKLDGVSAVYFNNKLYSRGNGKLGQDITELLEYLNLPETSKIIRGELIMKKKTFEEKWKGQFKNIRNAISGVVNSIGSKTMKKNEFVKDIEFLAYEIVDLELEEQLKPSKQFKELKNFNTPKNEIIYEISDDILSDLLDEYLKIEYEIDGLIIAQNRKYKRTVDKNPEHAKAFKKPLAELTKITKIIDIEWNQSKDGYLKPTIIFEPIEVGGVNIERATAYNAKYIIDNCIGPNSIVEITRSGGVIPKIVRIIKKTKVKLPEIDCHWNDTNIDLIVDEENEEIIIKKLYYFLITIGVKGVGEQTVKKIYKSGFTKIKDLITLKADDIRFLGEKLPEKIIESIQKQLKITTLPMLMAGSGIFGRGLGTLRFETLIKNDPNFLNRKDIKNFILNVPSFSEIYAEQISSKAQEFLNFLEELTSLNFKPFEEVKGKLNVVMSGFRDQEIIDIVSKFGKVQDRINKETNLLIVKDLSVQSEKMKIAKERNIEILNKKEFLEKYN